MNNLLTPEFISKNFTQPNQTNSHHVQNTIGFSSCNNNKNQLLVIFGDSWAWGDELENRQQYNYGRILSEKLDADLLNLSCPGIGNQYISQLYQEFIKVKELYQSKYSNIYCIVVFTELAREFNSEFDQHRDYAHWLQHNIKSVSSYDEFLIEVDKPAIQALINSHSNDLTLKVAFNFIDPEYHALLRDYLLDRTWLEVCLEESMHSLSDTCYAVSPWLLTKLQQVLSMEWTLDSKTFRTWQIEKIEKAQKRLISLSDPKYFKPLYHPNQRGHELWAEYVYSKIKNEST